jgi:hypothetical protein
MDANGVDGCRSTYAATLPLQPGILCKGPRWHVMQQTSPEGLDAETSGTFNRHVGVPCSSLVDGV